MSQHERRWADEWQAYASALREIKQGLIRLELHTFKCALFLASSNAGDVREQRRLADLTDEHPAINGYVAGGLELTGVTFVDEGDQWTFDADDVEIPASGGPIGPAGFAVIYDVSLRDDLLVAVSLLPDVVAAEGRFYTIRMNEAGIFSLRVVKPREPSTDPAGRL